MRPLELTIDGFKSYRQRCSFNFEGRGLFGIVGPTGAGKSSILDALIYSLYGKTPRLERETKKLINSQADEAKLQLSFEMDGVAWEVTRVLRRKGQSQVVLRRLDEGAEPVTGDRNVNDTVPQVLGLDFGAFCASVCLSQGEFDRFLTATPSERVQILKGVFELDKVDRLREAARGHAGLINEQIRVFEGMLDALPQDPEAAIEQASSELAGARERVRLFREALPAVLSAEAELGRSGREEAQIQAEREETDLALAKVPSDSAVADLVARERKSSQLVDEGEKALWAAENAVTEAEKELAAIEARGRGYEWCSRLESSLTNGTSLEQDLIELAAVTASRVAELDRAAAALAGAGDEFREADEQLARKKAELAGQEQHHAAHLLKKDLRQGEQCPVCEQPVPVIPRALPPPALEGARTALNQAEEALARARNVLDSSKHEHTRAEERLRAARLNAGSVRTKMEENGVLVASLTQDGEDPQAALEQAREALGSATSRARAAAAARQEALAALQSASAARKALEAEMLATVSLLSGVCGRLGLDPSSAGREGLLQTAEAIRERAALKIEELDGRALELSRAVQAARAAVAAFRERFEVEPGVAPAEVLGATISRVDSLQSRMEELEDALRRRKDTERELASLSARKALYDRLSADLTDAKFTAYLLGEQTRLLCRLASEKFHELTGYYTFDFDDRGSITVVDERTGAVRSPQDTLSGGESFLASLSLALALAETVAGRGGRLECFFLDEGFGSLDAEALDRALDGIQTLAEPGRMIGLISHVGGIQSQLEDLIVLERLGDGSTSVVQDGGPIAYLPAAI